MKMKTKMHTCPKCNCNFCNTVNHMHYPCPNCSHPVENREPESELAWKEFEESERLFGAKTKNKNKEEKEKMTARSHATGNPIEFNKETQTWEYTDAAQAVSDSRPCKRCGEKPVLVRVKVSADLSHTGKAEWREFFIDACIAPIVKALQEGGVDMRGSCCGHGLRPKDKGEIYLQDRRTLVIINREAGVKHLEKGRVKK